MNGYKHTQFAPMPPPGHDYDERNYGPETASMDPYTLQITNRLAETEKMLVDVIMRVNRLNDKLFGANSLIPKDPAIGLDKSPKKSPKVAMMEQIVAQANVLNRRVGDLSEVVSRLETL